MTQTSAKLVQNVKKKIRFGRSKPLKSKVVLKIKELLYVKGFTIKGANIQLKDELEKDIAGDGVKDQPKPTLDEVDELITESIDKVKSSKADPDVLSDYIVALLENYNEPLDESFVTTMSSKLEDFLSNSNTGAIYSHVLII